VVLGVHDVETERSQDLDWRTARDPSHRHCPVRVAPEEIVAREIGLQGPKRA
jgi:hypothetical protein